MSFFCCLAFDISPVARRAGEKQTLNATVAYFMGCGLAEQLAKRAGVSTQSLRVSVRVPLITNKPFPLLSIYEVSAPLLVSDEGLQGVSFSAERLFLPPFVQRSILAADSTAPSDARTEAGCMQIGRDPRISGPLLAAALAAGLTSKGVSVARFGYATTPAMFMSTIIEGVRQGSRHGPNLAVPSLVPYSYALS